MRIPRCPALILVGVCSVAAAGCSSAGRGQATTTSVTTPSGTPSTTTATSTSTTAAASAPAVNLAVTDAIRSQLVAAGAALDSIPVSEYSGLAPGLTFYALDRQSGTSWAGARLVPAPSSDPSTPTRAQVASQDDGSYYVFEQPQGGGWTAHPVGASGPGTPCPLAVPAAVAAVWGWPAGSCRAPGA
jgi:hypothetical protein